MKDSTVSEISNLFQELIVSKIKDEIELLKQEIENVRETNETCLEKVEKLPKPSSVKQIFEGEQTKVIEYIKEIAKSSKSEKYLKDIVAYLQKQYSFQDDRTLCMVLDEIEKKNSQLFDDITPIKTFVEANETEIKLNSIIEYIEEQCSFNEGDSLCGFLEQFSNKTEEKIGCVIANQDSFVEKYDAIVRLLGQYKDVILTQINSCTESAIQITKQIEKNQQAIEKNENSISNIIVIENDSVEKLISIQKLVESISQKNEQQSEAISSFYEKFDSLEESKNRMIKMLIAGNVITAIGVIGLILILLL